MIPLSKIIAPLDGEVSEHMAAPPEAVWALVTDPTRIGEFSPETIDGKWTRGSKGPEVGASFAGKVKRNGVGPTYWAPCKVTKCEQNEHFEWSVGTDSATFNNWGYRLEPEAGGTRVHEYFRLEPALPMRAYWSVFGHARRRTNKKGMQTTLKRIKAVVEQESGDGTAAG